MQDFKILVAICAIVLMAIRAAPVVEVGFFGKAVEGVDQAGMRFTHDLPKASSLLYDTHVTPKDYTGYDHSGNLVGEDVPHGGCLSTAGQSGDPDCRPKNDKDPLKLLNWNSNDDKDNPPRLELLKELGVSREALPKILQEGYAVDRTAEKINLQNGGLSVQVKNKNIMVNQEEFRIIYTHNQNIGERGRA